LEIARDAPCEMRTGALDQRRIVSIPFQHLVAEGLRDLGDARARSRCGRSLVIDKVAERPPYIGA
jgi:hypothetical protein